MTSLPSQVKQLQELAEDSYNAGNMSKAIDALMQVLRLAPEDAANAFDLGCLLEEVGRYAEATRAFKLTSQLRPDSIEAHQKLADCAVALEQPEVALAHYKSILQAEPSNALAWNNMGGILQKMDQLEAASRCFQQAIQSAPRGGTHYSNLAVVLDAMGRKDEALLRARQAVVVEPAYAKGWCNLGAMLTEQDSLTEAGVALRKAIEIDHDYADAFNNLGKLNRAIGLGKHSLDCYRRASELDPQSSVCRSNYVYASLFDPKISLSRVATLGKTWDEHHATQFRNCWGEYTGTLDPDRALRIGLSSAGFGRHPVGYFTLSVLENTNRQNSSIFIYSDSKHDDDFTTRFKKTADSFRKVTDFTDPELAELIRRDRIDILIDMSGHLAGNRLLAFARKPAPIQMKWVGYAGSTGLSSMDYLIGDRFHNPSNLVEQYREAVLEMPGAYVCYEPPEYAPAVGALPMSVNGYVTFGSCNQPVKYNEDVVRVWARILTSIPNSKLRLKYAGMDNPHVCERLTEAFGSHGVSPQSLEFFGRSSHQDFMQFINTIDVALDPFPFSGGLTTCEALWCGVPVVTLPGETFSSRHSHCYVSTVGHPEWSVPTVDEYVRQAIRLAANPDELSSIRSQLRHQMSASLLCDPRHFATAFSSKLRDAWLHHCEVAGR